MFSYSAEVGSNWKLFIDAFQEFYHAPVLHVKQSPASVGVPMMEAGFEAIHYSIHGDHRVVSTGGSRMDTAEVSTEFVKPIDILFRSGLFGPWDRPRTSAGSSHRA